MSRLAEVLPIASAATQIASIPPQRIQQMINVLLVNQALICQYAYGHIELHFKDTQVQAVMKHPLCAE